MDHVVWEVLVQIGQGVRVLVRKERGGKGEKGKGRRKGGEVRGESELYVNHTHTHAHTHTHTHTHTHVHTHTHLRESLVLSPQPVPGCQLSEALQVHPVQSTNVVLAVTKEILPVASVPKPVI